MNLPMPERLAHMSMRRAALPFILAILAAVSVNAHGQMDEYSIKAGYLYNFSKYVAWPEGTFAAPTAPFVICLIGEDPFGGRLDQAIAGKTSGDGRPLLVKRLKAPDRPAVRECQVLFLCKSQESRAAEIVEVLKETSIFSVADFDSFAEKGGIADLRIEGTRVKVDLNVNAANHANLKISARLQQVANLVH
jgi:hypothetical protein